MLIHRYSVRACVLSHIHCPFYVVSFIVMQSFFLCIHNSHTCVHDGVPLTITIKKDSGIIFSLPGTIFVDDTAIVRD